MLQLFTPRYLFAVRLIQKTTRKAEDDFWVLLSEAEVNSYTGTAAAIKKQYPGWGFWEWAEWLGESPLEGRPASGEVVEFPVEAIAA